MPTQDTGDTELIERIQRREPDGLAAAYDRYGPITYSLFVRITRDRTMAEDLQQELFMRIWNRARDFDATRGSFGVWIVSIARNMAIDHLRSAQARFNMKLRPIDNLDPSLFSQKAGEQESLIDRTRRVKAAFSSLNENERKVLELAYFEGFSQSEIASRLQEPLGTVKTWTRSGLGRLRIAMKAGAAQ